MTLPQQKVREKKKTEKLTCLTYKRQRQQDFITEPRLTLVTGGHKKGREKVDV